MPVFVNNFQQKTELSSSLTSTLEKVVQAALMRQKRMDDPEVTIALVDDPFIHDLNLRYRNMDKPTDVLSFSMEEQSEESGEDDGFFADGEDNILGDIIISVEAAERQAEEYGHSFIREMAYLAVHGVFHLLGYDHENEAARQVMRDKEEEVLKSLEIMR